MYVHCLEFRNNHFSLGIKCEENATKFEVAGSKNYDSVK